VDPNTFRDINVATARCLDKSTFLVAMMHGRRREMHHTIAMTRDCVASTRELLARLTDPRHRIRHHISG
jgi:hypothetical protein